MVMKSPDDNSSTPAKTQDKVLKQNEWMSPRIKKGYGIYKSNNYTKAMTSHRNTTTSQPVSPKGKLARLLQPIQIKKLVNQKNLLAILLHLGHLA
jgi:hypothetical protein